MLSLPVHVTSEQICAYRRNGSVTVDVSVVAAVVALPLLEGKQSSDIIVQQQSIQSIH